MKLKPIRAINPKKPVPKGWTPIIEVDEKGRSITTGYTSAARRRRTVESGQSSTTP